MILACPSLSRPCARSKGFSSPRQKPSVCYGFQSKEDRLATRTRWIQGRGVRAIGVWLQRRNRDGNGREDDPASGKRTNRKHSLERADEAVGQLGRYGREKAHKHQEQGVRAAPTLCG